MKYILATAAATLLLGAATLPATAEDTPAANGSSHTMGDSGKLPASGAVTDRIPDMGAGTGSSTGTDGTTHRMGDDGKLPATNSMSNEVPKMTSPSATDK